MTQKEQSFQQNRQSNAKIYKKMSHSTEKLTFLNYYGLMNPNYALANYTQTKLVYESFPVTR